MVRYNIRGDAAPLLLHMRVVEFHELVSVESLRPVLAEGLSLVQEPIGN